MTPQGAILSRLRRAAAAVLPPRALIAAVAWSKWYLGEKEMRLLPWICTRDRAGIDIGANAGVYTWHLRRLCGEVHAFEPIPELADSLRASLTGCVIHGYALSDQPGTATLQIPVFHGEPFAALASITNGFERAERVLRIDVRLARLDDEGIRNIGFIKIDAEGHERRILMGARSVLLEQRPTLQVEIKEESAPGGIGATVALLEQHGYDAWYFHGGRLLPFSKFDARLLQNPAMMSDDGWSRGPYVDNFLFFPRVPAWPGQREAIERFGGT